MESCASFGYPFIFGVCAVAECCCISLSFYADSSSLPSLPSRAPPILYLLISPSRFRFVSYYILFGADRA